MSNDTIIRRWSAVVRHILHLARTCWRTLRVAVRLGIVEYEIYNQVVLEGDGGLVNARKREAKNKLYKEMETRQQTCHHPAFHRYGNRHGSYAKCLQCSLRWRWGTRNNTQGWILDGLCSSSQRHPPSPLTTLDGSMGSMAIPPLLGQIDGYRVPIPEGAYGIGLPGGAPHVPSSSSVTSAIYDILGGRPWTERPGGDAGLRRPDEPQRVPVSGRLPTGRLKRLGGSAMKSVNILEKEVMILNSLPTAADRKFGFDLCEAFAGTAKATQTAQRYGLHALQPFERDLGTDLNTSEGKKLFEHAVYNLGPLLVLAGCRCTHWSVMNENCNYAHRMEELMMLRDAESPLLRWFCKTLAKHVTMGGLILLENPKRSRFWEEKAVKELISMENMILVDCDAGAFGGKDLDGYDIIKTYRFLTNSQDIADRECRPLEGKNVTFSQVYPDKLVDAIMKGLQAEARRRAPTRFDTHEVMVAEPVEDFTAWGQILEEVRKIFMKSTTKAMNLEQGTELFKKISRLIPWELTRVQVAVTPMARRLPRDINYSHRGAVLLLSDGKMMIEVEDVRQVQFPKARFENPISAAIFFYGFTEEDAPPQGQPAPEDPLLPVVGLRTDITFPGIPLNVSKEVRASVARLHVNAGHPSKQELKRLLAAHGALNLPVVTALEHIKCGSCERTAKHLQPRPAALPTFQGQFAERLQADLVYIRDLSGTNHAVLGVVCMLDRRAWTRTWRG
ncbi:unnamed protein product [Effrenium voratum]|nr:unnamed protein product [Effrenium voratum]